MQDGIELLKHTLLLTLKKSKNKTRSIHTPLHPTHTHQQGDDVQDGVELLERLAELALRHRAVRALQLLLQLRQRVHLRGKKGRKLSGSGYQLRGGVEQVCFSCSSSCTRVYNCRIGWALGVCGRVWNMAHTRALAPRAPAAASCAANHKNMVLGSIKNTHTNPTHQRRRRGLLPLLLARPAAVDAGHRSRHAGQHGQRSVRALVELHEVWPQRLESHNAQLPALGGGVGWGGVGGGWGALTGGGASAQMPVSGCHWWVVLRVGKFNGQACRWVGGWADVRLPLRGGEGGWCFEEDSTV